MKTFVEKLRKCFSIETCHHSYRHKWSPKNSSVGHCAIVSLLFYEMFGYSVYKVKVGNFTHYFNIDSDNEIIDITADQFGKSIIYESKTKCNPKQMLKVKDTKERLELLKEKLLLEDTK